jgi:hypothetical protein
MEQAISKSSLNSKSLQVPYLILKFLSHDGQVFLESTEFAFSGAEVLRCTRGTNSVLPNVGTFRWNQAVRAVCILALRYFIYRESDRAEDRSLVGGAGSLAASLDYSIAKNTGWLSEVFGSDSKGTLVVRKLITRQNPERKRPGPVVVAFTKNIADMGFYLNGEELVSKEALHGLLALLEPSADSTSQGDGIIGSTSGESGGRSALPTHNRYINAELARYVQIVLGNTFRPYISTSTTEVWSAADAILALVRIPGAQEHLRKELPVILEMLRPQSSGGYTIEESDLPIPIITATCIWALAELGASAIVGDRLRPLIDEFSAVALDHLLDCQALPGWWTIIGAPVSVLEYGDNARVWDTAYIVLVLEHLLRLGRRGDRIEKARSRALTWLLDVYDPKRGWTNAPSLPFRISPALNTLVHFVLMSTGAETHGDSCWTPVQAKRHVESLLPSLEWVEALDKSDFRLKGAKGLSLPHPHHMNHGAFLLALIKSLEGAQLDSEELEGAQLDSEESVKLHVPWEHMFTQLEKQKPVYLFSQVLQATHLFNCM